MKAFDVYLPETGKSKAGNEITRYKNIDTVFYADSDPITAAEVYRSLVDHDGYDSRIVVQLRN